jgi:glyoxylase-like metal-dependent hydrolase (beta-lactamase superfamily II)
VGANALGLECFPSPGHASHHVCYLGDDGTLYAGDAAGVRLQPDRTVLPPTPPPEFDLEAWNRTIDEIERRKPSRLALVHFGIAEDPGPHLAELRQRLAEWSHRVAEGVTEEEFHESVRSDVIEAGGDVETYERAMPFWQSYAGLKRYWDKRSGP